MYWHTNRAYWSWGVALDFHVQCSEFDCRSDASMWCCSKTEMSYHLCKDGSWPCFTWFRAQVKLQVQCAGPFAGGGEMPQKWMIHVCLGGQEARENLRPRKPLNHIHKLMSILRHLSYRALCCLRKRQALCMMKRHPAATRRTKMMTKMKERTRSTHSSMTQSVSKLSMWVNVGRLWSGDTEFAGKRNALRLTWLRLVCDYIK